MLIRLTNSFHNTEVTLRVKPNRLGNLHLSRRQAQRAKRELCFAGCEHCTDIGVREYELIEVRPGRLIRGLDIEILGDGTARLID